MVNEITKMEDNIRNVGDLIINKCFVLPSRDSK